MFRKRPDLAKRKRIKKANGGETIRTQGNRNGDPKQQNWLNTMWTFCFATVVYEICGRLNSIHAIRNILILFVHRLVITRTNTILYIYALRTFKVENTAHCLLTDNFWNRRWTQNVRVYTLRSILGGNVDKVKLILSSFKSIIRQRWFPLR